MMRVASNAGRHPAADAHHPFVHWHTTAPPGPDAVEQFSREKYPVLAHAAAGMTRFPLVHQPELATEIKLVRRVYRASLEYNGPIRRSAGGV